jgi:hypothetical protein
MSLLKRRTKTAWRVDGLASDGTSWRPLGKRWQGSLTGDNGASQEAITRMVMAQIHSDLSDHGDDLPSRVRVLIWDGREKEPPITLVVQEGDIP